MGNICKVTGNDHKSNFFAKRRKSKVVCGISILLALSETGRIYEAITEDIHFKEVDELQNNEFVDIAGSTFTFFAVSKDGSVFGKGINNYGQLGFPEEINRLDTFTYVKSLKDHKIVAASSASRNSLFKTIDSKLIGCGCNSFYPFFLEG